MLKKWTSFANSVHAISRVLAFIGAFCGVAIMVMAVTDVAVRSFKGQGILGVDGIIESLLVAMIFLGMAEVERKKGHIAFGMVVDRLPSRLTSAVQALGMGLATVLVGWIAWLTAGQAWQSLVTGETRFGDVALLWWPAKAVLTLGVSLLFIEMVITVVGHVIYAAVVEDIEGLAPEIRDELLI